ncbi:cell adhesion molecule Dscam2-like isoform X3 [Frankliniella occidentalis]|uniref:Cell adhesion molecule Dscam2-like isoform X3 n=1 Tax=Frankliniella occidentalis TaxID=133901 RepID=A0A9C6WSR9_FRAOC|nr:cell adhesion molecule Dscam2-like isoform X3 [Frankliniella occidentalis]
MWPHHTTGPPTARPTLNLTAVADTDVFLRCPVAGFPVTSVTWQRAGSRLPDTLRQRLFPNGTLLLRGVQGAQDRGLYACTVTNQQGQLAASALHLNVMKPPVIVPFSFHSGLEDGNRLQVSCSIMSGDLPIAIEWRKDGRPLPADPSVSEQQHQFASNLLFSDLGARHSGSYTCVASNAAASANFTAPLVVRVRPRWLVEPQDVEVLHQESAAVHCRASGFPEPTVTWLKAPEQVGPGSGSGPPAAALAPVPDEGSAAEYAPLGDPLLAVAENGSVLVAAAQPSHAGRYMCQARNGIGPGISKVVHLRVKVPAHFHTRAVNVSGAAGQSVVLECAASGDQPLSIVWTTPDGEEPSPNRVLETPTLSPSSRRPGLSSQLHLTAERRLAGAYRCTATNKHGSDTTTVFLAVQEAPSAPVGVEVLEAGSRWLTLGWVPDRAGATHHVIQFRRELPPTPRVLSPSAGGPEIGDASPPGAAGQQWYNVTVSGAGAGAGRPAKLTGLEPATVYAVRLLAANEVGVGPPSDTVTAQTLQEAPNMPPADVSVEPLSPGSLTVRWKSVYSSPSSSALLGYQVRYRAVSLAGQPSLSALLLPASSLPADLDAAALDAPAAPWVSRTVRGGGGAPRQELVLEGLESFTRYEVTVRAFNEVGSGPASLPVIATTMEGVPTEPPGSVRCTPLTSQNVRVRWEPPPKAGRRGVLDGYKVFFRRKPPTGLSVAWMTPRPEMEVKKTMNLETNLFGLAKFSNYTVQVAALTGAGEGVRSEPVHCSTEEDVPGPPEQVKALAMSSDSILVTWTRPLESNGNIVRYLVYMKPYQPDGHSSKDARREVSYASGDRGAELAYEVRRLQESERLEFWVAAYTSVGEGPPSARVSQAPVSRVPARIASFSRTAAAGEGQMLTLACRAVGVPAPARTWRGPRGLARTVAANGGQGDGQAEDNNNRAVLLGDGSLRLGPLSHQDAGNYSCRAVNVFGNDEVQYRVVVVGPPAAPALTLAATSDRTLTLTWAASDPGGAPVTGYVLHFKRELGEWQERELDGELSSYTLTGLRCGSLYLLTLTAVNSVGRGARSAVLQAATRGAPPKAPAAEEVLSVNSSTATLFLDAWPVAGCPVLYFVVDVRPYEHAGEWTVVDHHALAQQTLAVAGLAPASWYELRVDAHSEAGSTRGQFVFATRTKTGDAVPLELMPALPDSPGSLALPTPVTLLVAVVSGLVCTAAAATCAIIAFRKRRGDAKTLDELQNQRNLEHHHHHVHHGHQGLHHQQDLYSPSPVRKGGVTSSLTGQKGSDTSDYEICPYATFSLSNATPGAGPVAGAGTLTPSKSLASYSLQLHTFSQRDCYAEGPPPSARRNAHSRSRSKSSLGAVSGAAVAARAVDGGDGAAPTRPTASPPDGLSLEISCISSQQTLPMSLAMRRKAASPTHGRGVSRPRSLVGTPGPPAGCGGRYESDSSSPSDKHHQQMYGYRPQHGPLHAQTPKRRSSRSHDNGADSSAESTDELGHRSRREAQVASCRSLPRRSSGSPRSRSRSRQQQQPLSKPRWGTLDGSPQPSGSGSGSDAGIDPNNGDPVAVGQVHEDGDNPSRSQLDAQERELSSLIKRYRYDRQREKDYTIHV